MFLATLLMSLREIRRNTLRSLLTMLGVIIGVGAVVVLVTLGEGASAKVESDIAKLGDNLLIVSPGANRRGPGFSGSARPFERADVAAIESEVSGLAGIAPAAQQQTPVVSGNRNWRTSVIGTTPDYLDVRGYDIGSGRAFTESEVSSGRAVVVLGATVRKELFGNQDPIGQQVRIGRMPAEVIGVLAAKGQAAMGQDQDDVVLLPLVTFQRRIAGNTDIGSIYVSAAEGRPTVLVQSQIESLLRQRRRPSGEDDFNVRDMAEIAATMASATGAMTALLGAIAGVSLLVGGIGIMNIMLVSVTERTREIGIRLSIGALPREVLLQFLVEAVVLSSLGGAIGILSGLSGGWFAARALAVPFVILPQIVLVAFLFSAAVGVVFGILPARRAARLNPIEALRHE
ncbi:MAG: putative transport system permease protein [Acidobacteriota bacterium]|jgi:putative ABC transport system permease protein|nr:putative transport system permease protein [Acidobacteriota bacterium]